MLALFLRQSGCIAVSTLPTVLELVLVGTEIRRCSFDGYNLPGTWHCFKGIIWQVIGPHPNSVVRETRTKPERPSAELCTIYGLHVRGSRLSFHEQLLSYVFRGWPCTLHSFFARSTMILPNFLPMIYRTGTMYVYLVVVIGESCRCCSYDTESKLFIYRTRYRRV